MKNHYLFSQPHQAFFVLAFANALLSMFLFMLLFKGIISSEILSLNYHAYSFIFLTFTPAMIGFLFLMFPHFSATETIKQQHYFRIFSLFLVGSVLFQLSSFLSAILITLSMIIVFIAHTVSVYFLYQIYHSSTLNNKDDQAWVLLAMMAGLMGHSLFILSLWMPIIHQFSIQISIYLYLFILIFVIAQKMIPLYAHVSIKKHHERFKVIIGLLALHVLLETIQNNGSFLADFLLAYLLGKELYRWELPISKEEPMLWVLYLALLWVPIAFFLSGLTHIIALSNGTNFLSLEIHALALGFFLTLLIGLTTRVTLEKSKHIIKADKLTIILFYWTQIVVLFRVVTSLAVANDWNFVLFFDLSITVWMVLFGLWASKFFAVLIFGKKLQSE